MNFQFLNFKFQILLGILFVVGLVYLLVPGPKSINDFPAPPNSAKSDEPGDTYQNPNIAGYYGDNRRAFIISFYKNFYDTIKIGNLTLPSIRLNHPPEDAFQYIRDQQLSTYLEEDTYPLRGSIFVNGYEPYDINGKRFNSGALHIVYKNKPYDTKVTIRYYYVPVLTRLVVYLLYWVFGLGLYFLIKRSLKYA